jgi:DNA-binding NarL/FixJ family response regulator
VTRNLAMVSRSLLLREALVQRLSLLGVDIAAVSDFQTLGREMEDHPPALVLVDGDGWEQPWDALVRGLNLKARGVPALLLIASLGVDQVLEAPSLGVGTIILKPFKPEEHTARVYDLFLAAQSRTPRRAHPRYAPTNGQRLEMEILPEGDWVARRLPVLDISGGGARIELPDPPAAAGLAPGSRWAVAGLAAGGARASVSFRVVHRSLQSIGVVFEQLIDRNGAFREILQGFDRRVFGSVVPHRGW